MITCSTVPPWETTTKLPAGLTGRLIANHFGVPVDEVRPEHIGEGLSHIRRSFMPYKDPRFAISTDDSETDNRLAELYRKYPDLAVIGSADGLGHLGIQNDSGLYLLVRISNDRLLEPKEELVESSDGRQTASGTRTDFANRCRDFMTELNEVLGLNLKVVSLSEFNQRLLV